MEILGGLLAIVGGIAAVVGGIWLLVLAFQTHIGWGLAYIFIPFAALVFVIMHWEESKKPFLISIGGAVVMILGSLLMGQPGTEPV